MKIEKMLIYQLEELSLECIAAREELRKFLSNLEDSVTPSRPALRKRCTPLYERGRKYA